MGSVSRCPLPPPTKPALPMKPCATLTRAVGPGSPHRAQCTHRTMISHHSIFCSLVAPPSIWELVFPFPRALTSLRTALRPPAAQQQTWEPSLSTPSLLLHVQSAESCSFYPRKVPQICHCCASCPGSGHSPPHWPLQQPLSSLVSCLQPYRTLPSSTPVTCLWSSVLLQDFPTPLMNKCTLLSTVQNRSHSQVFF